MDPKRCYGFKLGRTRFVVRDENIDAITHLLRQLSPGEAITVKVLTMLDRDLDALQAIDEETDD